MTFLHLLSPHAFPYDRFPNPNAKEFINENRYSIMLSNRFFVVHNQSSCRC